MTIRSSRRTRRRLALCLALVWLVQLAGAADAQLPTAAGTQVAMSQSAWRMFIPSGYTPAADGKVNLLVHFHGDSQTVWNNAAYADLDAVIVTVNYSGLSSAYSNPFSNTSLFQTLLNDARSRLASRPGFGASTTLGHLSVSSFSAGYGAVREILKAPAYRNEIDSLLAADSLYATTASDGTALDSQMTGYKAFADAAAAGLKRFIFTHSEIPIYTYESTAETGDELLAHLGLTAQPINQSGLGTLDFYRTAELGGFTLWGARGMTGDDHLAHLRYLGEWLGDLQETTPDLPGDYNGDGVADAADYTVWRDTEGSTTNLAADGNPDRKIDAGDYTVWQFAYGNTLAEQAAAVPEPTAAGVTLLALATVLPNSWRGRSR
ncbi:hypothetical protein [Botrimarina colliarenosi]|nr:hypothetical protein [Botrimarina colliarenosi]